VDFDLGVLGTVLGGAATALLTRFLGITQRLASMERRVDTQAELIANLHGENTALRQKVADQDKVIGEQARLVGDLTRSNRGYAAEVRRLTAAVQAAEGRAKASAAEMDLLRDAIRGSRDKPSGLPADLYEPLPRPPKLPKI
jgi:uncharacterized coiled-coil protein SlyX